MTTVEGRAADGRGVRVQIASGRIAAMTDLPDAPDLLILPGLVDIQVNGFAGHDINAGDVTPDDVIDMVRALWRRGTTTVLPTVITAAEPAISASLNAIARAREKDDLVRLAVPGIHVEGPYLSPQDGPRGAHDERHLRDPDIAEYERWQEACGGLVKIVTLAPERRGAAEFIAHITSRGTVAAIGHTAAQPHEITRAVTAGATLSTHLGNGAHAMLPRHPNYLWTQLAEPRLSASFIADGHHLPADTLTAMLRAKGAERSVLVSDSVALAGCPPGAYNTPVGGQVTAHADGRLTLDGSTLLAGSGRCLLDCVAWLVEATGFSLRIGVRLAATNPARLLGLTTFQPGAPADLVVTTAQLDVRRTFVHGQEVFST